jgi:hypothetical protein
MKTSRNQGNISNPKDETRSLLQKAWPENEGIHADSNKQ